MSTAIQSDSGAYAVHHGFWINWTSGKVNGATITLSKESGGLLIASLALYISAVGKSFWRLFCFILHAYFSNESPQDGLYHQRQAILRNAESATQVAWSFFLATFAWERHAKRRYQRMFPTSIFALLIWGAFAVAGIFSSRVTTNDANDVLLSGKNCGILSNHAATNSVSMDNYWNFVPRQTAAYLTYSLQCYENQNAEKSENCRPYIEPKLSYSVVKNASCPFDRDICLTEKNLLLDTGYVNSHDDLGINEPSGKRFSFRNVVQCAPLVTKGFSKMHLSQGKGLTIPVMRYYYGIEVSESLPGIDPSFSFQVPVNFSTITLDNSTSQQGTTPDYSIG